jgi:hypothetical protein
MTRPTNSEIVLAALSKTQATQGLVEDNRVVNILNRVAELIPQIEPRRKHIIVGRKVKPDVFVKAIREKDSELAEGLVDILDGFRRGSNTASGLTSRLVFGIVNHTTDFNSRGGGYRNSEAVFQGEKRGTNQEGPTNQRRNLTKY